MIFLSIKKIKSIKMISYIKISKANGNKDVDNLISVKDGLKNP